MTLNVRVLSDVIPSSVMLVSVAHEPMLGASGVMVSSVKSVPSLSVFPAGSVATELTATAPSPSATRSAASSPTTCAEPSTGTGDGHDRCNDLRVGGVKLALRGRQIGDLRRQHTRRRVDLALLGVDGALRRVGHTLLGVTIRGRGGNVRRRRSELSRKRRLVSHQVGHGVCLTVRCILRDEAIPQRGQHRN